MINNLKKTLKLHVLHLKTEYLPIFLNVGVLVELMVCCKESKTMLKNKC